MNTATSDTERAIRPAAATPLRGPAQPPRDDVADAAHLQVGERFGRAVRRSREAHGWSQEALAARADLNRSYLGEIERGTAMPSIATAAKLAHALGLTLSSLISRYEQA